LYFAKNFCILCKLGEKREEETWTERKGHLYWWPTTLKAEQGEKRKEKELIARRGMYSGESEI